MTYIQLSFELNIPRHFVFYGNPSLKASKIICNKLVIKRYETQELVTEYDIVQLLL